MESLAIAKPRRLRPGDTVGVIAPSGVVDETRLAAGIRVLEGWGLRVMLGALPYVSLLDAW